MEAVGNPMYPRPKTQIFLFKDGFHGDLSETYFVGNVSHAEAKQVISDKEEVIKIPPDFAGRTQILECRGSTAARSLGASRTEASVAAQYRLETPVEVAWIEALLAAAALRHLVERPVSIERA